MTNRRLCCRDVWMVAVFLVACISPSLERVKTQYPQELHERVIERLSRRRGALSRESGSWSSWSNWSPCSRSCGTGVSTQTRDCVKRRKKLKNASRHPGTKCVGRYKRFQLCNTHECPSGVVDLRREQCFSFNRTPFNKRFYNWEPYTASAESCSLNCRAVGLNFYATLNQSVIDGTPCGDVSPGETPRKLCAGGKCLSIGCDGLLGSSKHLDQCGVCGGDGGSCKLISSSFNHARLPDGYNIITTLPPEAQNVSIYHIAPSDNFIALREKRGKYLLNGPVGMNSSGTSRASGQIVSYQKSRPSQGDRIFIRGPLTTPIDVLIFYRSTNPGVHMEYRLETKPKNLSNSPNYSERAKNLLDSFPQSKDWNNDDITVPKYLELRKKKHKNVKKFRKGKKRKIHEKRRRKRYMWVAKGYSPCSASCGQGSQSTRIICVKRRKKEIEVPVQMCTGLEQPFIEIVKCNLRPCQPQWEASDWSACSVTCGIGYQTRTLQCQRTISKISSVPLEKAACQEAKPPQTSQICEKRECNGMPIWEMGEWSKCSSDCGLGTRRRTVVCLSVDGPVDDIYCKEKRPLDEELCDMGSCATDTWLFSEWDNECNGPCGEGRMTRSVYCSQDGHMTTNTPLSCSLESKPQESKQCDSTDKCKGTWFTGPWNECDALTCGHNGQKRRTVICITWDRRRYKIAKDESYCKAAGDKPAGSAPCKVQCVSKWFTSQWSQCSVSCGHGFRRREVKCLDGRGEPSLECSRDKKPDSRANCHLNSCTKETPDGSEGPVTTVAPEVLHPKKKLRETLKDFHKSFKGSCMDRMKNCPLVLQARLCKLKHYNNLCCETCKQQ